MTDTLSREQLFAHWMGHRNLTRRMIEAFPSDETFAEFSVGEMRPFAKLIAEFLQMGQTTIQGLTTGEWPWVTITPPSTRAEALKVWDAENDAITAAWPALTPEHLQATHKAFGQWEMPGYGLLMYVIDNEIHHRGQATVYLRALGVEPAAFPDRSKGGGATAFR